jgi:TonB family protein
MQAAETAQADRGVRTNSSAQADGGVQTNGGADELRRLLYSLIEKRLAYPPPAQERGIQGTVALVLQIGPEGQLLYSGVSHSSGSAVLDRAAGNVIAGIFPLEGIRMDKIEVITINVDYRLQ